MARTRVVVLVVMFAGALAASAQEGTPAPAGQATLAVGRPEGAPARMTLADVLAPAPPPPDQDKAVPERPKNLDEKLEDFRKSLPFDMHGGAYLYYYQPFVGTAKNDMQLYAAWLTLDAKADDFGFHWEERFRDTPLRPFFQSNIWDQEIYGSWNTPELPGLGSLGTLKMGKEYTRYGHFWDGSFYGNVLYFDGFKLDPEYGFSLENSRKLGDFCTLEYDLQFFIEDGRTNGSLGGGASGSPPRDTIGDTSAGGRRRNDVIARVAPIFHLGADVDLTVGLSVQDFRADFTGAAQDDKVNRYGPEAELKIGSVTMFGEYDKQRGSAVPNDPLGGPPSRDNAFWWAGIEYTWSFLTLRYNWSEAIYRDSRLRETLHNPGVVFALQKHVSLWFEWMYWRQDPPGHASTFDNSLNVVLDLHF
jgi:hypothetical protein